MVALARTAAAFGASVCTSTRAENVTDYGARLVDTLTGEGFDVYARTVVNAAGRWAEGIDHEAILAQGGGTHLVIDAARLGNPTAGLSVPLGNSVSDLVSILPAQLGRAYIGFTAAISRPWVRLSRRRVRRTSTYCCRRSTPR